MRGIPTVKLPPGSSGGTNPAPLLITEPDGWCTSCTKTFVASGRPVPVVVTLSTTLNVSPHEGVPGLRAIPLSRRLGATGIGVAVGRTGKGGGVTAETPLKSPDGATTKGEIQPSVPFAS